MECRPLPIANILEKLGLKNTIELVKYAIRHKIILLE
jgi:DNA-binding NarL/FixJ family response regulator